MEKLDSIHSRDESQKNKGRRTKLKILNNFKEKLINPYQKLEDKVRSALREKAIENAKSTIALSGQKVADLDQDELESIVKVEEDKIKASFSKGIVATGLLAFLGLS